MIISDNSSFPFFLGLSNTAISSHRILMTQKVYEI